jgi:hypothetical protein
MPQDNSFISYQPQTLKSDGETTLSDELGGAIDHSDNVKQYGISSLNAVSNSLEKSTTPPLLPTRATVADESCLPVDIPAVFQQALLLHPLHIPRFVRQHGSTLSFPQIVRFLQTSFIQLEVC